MKVERDYFESIIERRGTNCARWDTMDKKYNQENLIHLGVADMDFRAPDAVIESFQKVVDHGIFGYTDLFGDFYNSISRWIKRQHQVDVKKEEIIFCPRITIAASLAIESLTEKGDEILINTPAYGPLYQAIIKNQRKVLESPLQQDGEIYRIDFEHMESLITPKTKMYILCSPHNPVGRVWSREEMKEIGLFCQRHNLLLFVDEIHSDILAPSVKFTSALHFPEQVRSRVILATSMTKTFNVPGVILSYMIVENENIRDCLKADIERIGMNNPNIFSVAAVEAAYNHCDTWYEEMLDYINGNDEFTRWYFAEHFPEINIFRREATYLLWMDCRALGCDDQELEKWFIQEAKVAVYMGNTFGKEGRGFIRVNIASPRALLQEAYERMRQRYDSIRRSQIT